MHRLVAELPQHLCDYTLFGYIIGMRKSAISSLEWTAVHGDQITLAAEDNKTREPLTIALEGELGEIIARRRQVANGPLIFHMGDGRPIRNFWKSWRSATRRAGLQGRLFHDLRRCASKNMLEAGVPQRVAMTITGHKTDSMFRRYAIVEPRQQREALRKVEQWRAEQLVKEVPAAPASL